MYYIVVVLVKSMLKGNCLVERALKFLSLVLVLTVLSVQSSFGQHPLSGSWGAHCVIEQTDRASITFCGLCPHTISEDRGRLSFENFKMVFEDDYLNLVFDDTSATVDCNYDEDLNINSFTYNEEDFALKVLTVIGTDHQILKTDGGLLILLEKEE